MTAHLPNSRENLLERLRVQLRAALQRHRDSQSSGGVPERRRRKGRRAAKNGLDRREFVAVTGGGLAATGVLAGCANSSKNPGPGIDDTPSATAAAGVSIGTELFQDTVYAEPVVPANAVGSHAVIEGARRHLRIQSDLASNQPLERLWLDNGYHRGLPELVQIEEDPTTGEKMVVHYRRPWKARTDGGRTDGFERELLLTEADGLQNPTAIHAVTGSYTNKFMPIDGVPGAAFANAQYMLLIEEDVSGRVGQLLIGWAATFIQGGLPQSASAITWQQIPLTNGMLNVDDSYQLAQVSKFTGAAWVSQQDSQTPTYHPEQQVEHLVLHYDGPAGGSDRIAVLTLMNNSTEYPELTITWLYTPQGVTDKLRLTHIDWDATDRNSGWQQFGSIVLANTSFHSDGSLSYRNYFINREGNVFQEALTPRGNVRISKIFFDSTGSDFHGVSVDASSADGGRFALDFSKLGDVHTLHSTYWMGNVYNLKLCMLEGRGPLLLLNVASQFDIRTRANSTETQFYLGGHFPLALPDDAGLGNLTTLCGGSTRFGGFRFVAADDNGNAFLLRQRRKAGLNTPYPPAIYGLNDANGVPGSIFPNAQEPFPDGTTSASNLNSLDHWVSASTTWIDPDSSYNFLQRMVAAFGTDDSNVCQGVWLGNTYTAVYAGRHFGLDNEHVSVTQNVDPDTNQLQYAVSMVFSNPVDRTWRKRPITYQTLPKGPGLQESGDHYQAIVRPVNANGQQVSFLAAENAHLQIEVRADSPCTVIDDTNNLYHDVDRYTSFFAKPDPSTGMLSLLVKADTFSQVLYVRLVDTSSLETTSSDPALVKDSGGTLYAWQSVNMATEAQHRMANSVDGVAASPMLQDSTVYVSGATLTASDQANPWQVKSSFDTTPSNFDNLAGYLNTSGTNILAATSSLTPDGGDAIDPLSTATAYPADPDRPTITSHFDYLNGTVSNTAGSAGPALQGDLGSIWSSVSHALHDVLHFLQHATPSVYSQLASDGVKLISAAEGLTASVAADIMKLVTGVEQELEELLSTVEEYANVVANLIVTIVENTFIGRFIELLIELISLFQHLAAVQNLSRDLQSNFAALLGANPGGPPVPIPGFDFTSVLDPLLGPANDVQHTMESVEVDQIADEVVQTVYDLLAGNPFVNKVLGKVQSELNAAWEALTPQIPIHFNLDSAATASLADQIVEIVEAVAEGVVDVGEDVLDFLIDEIVDLVANPRAAYSQLGQSVGDTAAEIVVDALEPVLQKMQDLLSNDLAFAAEALTTADFVTVDLGTLADLLKLLGVGDVSAASLTLRTGDAVFFPMALGIWTSAYLATGKSYSSLASMGGSTQQLGGVSPEALGILKLSVAASSGLFTEIGHGIWVYSRYSAATSGGGGSSNELVQRYSKYFGAVGSWVNAVVRSSLFLAVMVETQALGQPDDPFDGADKTIRFITGLADVFYTLPDENNNPGSLPADPRPTDITGFINFLSQLANLVGGTADQISKNPNMTLDQFESMVGGGLLQVPSLVRFCFDLVSSTKLSAAAIEEAIIPAGLVVGGMTGMGTGLQVAVLAKQL